ALRDPSHAGGPAPHPLLVRMKALAERGMGMRYLDTQVIIAQDESLRTDTEAASVARQRLQLSRDPAARGEPDLMRCRVELEDVTAIGTRLRRHDGPVDDQMEARVGGG